MTVKSVLISIRPMWCDLIKRGKKTLEVRKTKPKLKTPFKCYIYCTKAPKGWFWLDSPSVRRDGSIIGEFICDTFVIDKTFGHDSLFNGAACMMEINCAIYSCGSLLYGWHISDLKIYDRPKKLSEFIGVKTVRDGFEVRLLERPPQSWCYVEG